MSKYMEKFADINSSYGSLLDNSIYENLLGDNEVNTLSGLADNVPANLPQNLPKNLPQNLPKNLPQNLPNDVPQNLPNDVPQNLPNDVSTNSLISDLQLSLNNIQNTLNNPSISQVQDYVIGDLYNLQNNLNTLQSKLSPSVTNNPPTRTNNINNPPTRTNNMNNPPTRTNNNPPTRTSETKVVSSEPQKATSSANYTNLIIFFIILCLLTYLFFSGKNNDN